MKMPSVSYKWDNEHQIICMLHMLLNWTFAIPHEEDRETTVIHYVDRVTEPWIIVIGINFLYSPSLFKRRQKCVRQ